MNSCNSTHIHTPIFYTHEVYSYNTMLYFPVILGISILSLLAIGLSNEVFAQSQLEDGGKLELANLRFEQFGKSNETFVVNEEVKVTYLGKKFTKKNTLCSSFSRSNQRIW